MYVLSTRLGQVDHVGVEHLWGVELHQGGLTVGRHDLDLYVLGVASIPKAVRSR